MRPRFFDRDSSLFVFWGEIDIIMAHMSEALYRKYRPQTFSEVLGQDVVKTIVQNAIKLGRVSHAYLFSGPRGVGKTTIARLLAKAVNCRSPQDGEPDTTCENCQLIQQGRFLDLLEIDAASYTGVDNIREIIDHVKFSPSFGKYKVFIIDEIHMLSKAAFNALLKTLEEPPGHAIFILATTEIHKVPATIISRSQRFDFKPVSSADILQLLERVLKDLRVEMPKEAKMLIAQAAEGSFRDALSILDQLLSFAGKKITSNMVEEILGITRTPISQNFLDLLTAGDAPAVTKFVKELAFEGKDLVQFTRNFLEYLRLVLFVKMDVEKAQELGLLKEETEKLSAQSQAISGGWLLELIKKTLEAYREMKTSPLPELPLLSQILTLSSKEEPSSKIQSDDKNSNSLNLGTIIDRWAEVLSRIKEYNHSLLGSLRLGRVVRLEGADLILAFPYNFHKETISARKNRLVIEQVLEDIFHQEIKVKAYLERELEKQSSLEGNKGDLLSEAIKILGDNSDH